MKRVIIMVSLLVPFICWGQNAFSAGKSMVQIGGGMGLMGIYGRSTLPPLTVMFDYAASDEISIGFVGGYSSSENLWQDYTYYAISGEYAEIGFKYSYTIIGARAAYHFAKSEKLDAYIGGTLGYILVSASAVMPDNIPEYLIPKASGSYALYGGFGGVRLFLSPSFGFYVEGGYGVSMVNGGIVLKF